MIINHQSQINTYLPTYNNYMTAKMEQQDIKIPYNIQGNCIINYRQHKGKKPYINILRYIKNRIIKY